MVNCLQLGAADFMLKPLRASELRNLWARVYWWRRVSAGHRPELLNFLCRPAFNVLCRCQLSLMGQPPCLTASSLINLHQLAALLLSILSSVDRLLICRRHIISLLP